MRFKRIWLMGASQKRAHDIRRSLARALDRAWAIYFRPGRMRLSQNIAVREMSKLVHLSKAGIRKLNRLSKN